MGIFDFLKKKKPKEQPEILNSAPFVVTENGELLSDMSGSSSDVQLASGAKNVLGAGRWVVIQGVARVITNESPAYQPTLEQMKSVVEFLINSGMALSDLLLVIYQKFDESGKGLAPQSYRVNVTQGIAEYIPE